MSQRGWLLFLVGCAGVLCLEGPDTVRWMGGQGTSLVRAAERARFEPAAPTYTSILTPDPVTIPAVPAIVPALFQGILAASEAALPVPDESAEAAPSFRLSGGCMPVPKQGPGEFETASP